MIDYPQVEQLWVALIGHPGPAETIPVVIEPGGERHTLVVAAYELVPALRKRARLVAKSIGKPVRIACFRVREDQELIEP